jgi:hypothetical protein
MLPTARSLAEWNRDLVALSDTIIAICVEPRCHLQLSEEGFLNGIFWRRLLSADLARRNLAAPAICQGALDAQC